MSNMLATDDTVTVPEPVLAPIYLISLNIEIGVLIILVGILLVLFVRRRATDLKEDTSPAEPQVTLTDLHRPALAEVFPRIAHLEHRVPPALNEPEPKFPANSPRGFFNIDLGDLPADIPQVLVPGGAAWRPPHGSSHQEPLGEAYHPDSRNL